MASLKADLRTLLLTQGAITAVVGSRVFSRAAAQDAVMPYIVLTVMETEGNPSLDGGTDNLKFVTLDIDCVAATGEASESLCQLVRAFIKDYTGAAGTQTIKAVIVNDQVDDEIWPTDSSGKPKYMETLDLTIQYNPA